MMIEVKHLCKTYGDVQPLKDVNCVINKGDIISIIGPSGTGKSTFVNCLNRLEDPDGGEIWFDGENVAAAGADLKKLRRRMGMVFQSFNLFGHLTIVENAMLSPVKLLGLSRREAYERSMELLERVGLADKALAYPSELSGGQQQRAAIVRTLAMRPEVVLFDEPTSALDPTMVGEVLSVIRSLAGEGLTMLIVTHEMRFARDVSSRIFYMDEGVIYEEGTPAQVFENPLRPKTRAFVRRLKVFAFETASSAFDYLAVTSDIRAFGQKHLLTPKQIHAVELVFEELCVNLLRPALERDKPFLRFTLEYGAEDGAIAIQADYSGESYDPLMSATDELSAAIVTNITTGWTHSYADGMNSVRCYI